MNRRDFSKAAAVWFASLLQRGRAHSLVLTLYEAGRLSTENLKPLKPRYSISPLQQT